jgi:hypothetical protein
MNTILPMYVSSKKYYTSDNHYFIDDELLRMILEEAKF